MPKESKTRNRTQDDPIQKKQGKKTQQQHAPLGQVITDDEIRLKYASSSRRNQNTSNNDGDDSSDDEFMDERTSARILKLSRDQLAEEERGDGSGDVVNVMIEEEDEEDDDLIHDKGYVTVDGPDYDEEQEAMVNAMMPIASSTERRNLADIILAKIAEKESSIPTPEQTEADQLATSLSLPPKVISVYTEIGQILSRYKSGKLPKAFKVIPSLSNWEDILYLTQPHLWTPQAMYAATRIFASNLDPRMAQRFYNLVLLDAIRADIHEYGKLNYHYYNSLIKSAYKPAAFFKGIILPLAKVESRCTLREAAIIASALRRISIPVNHSAVAIQKLAAGAYAPAGSVFLRELLNKKYSLPRSVVETLVVNHFGAFRDQVDVTLPILWHQCLLTFVQRYKGEIGSKEEYREILKGVMRVHEHKAITREVRRELFGSAAWREERGESGKGNNEMDVE